MGPVFSQCKESRDQEAPARQPPYSIRQKFLLVFSADNEGACKNRRCCSIELQFGLPVDVIIMMQNGNHTSSTAAWQVVHWAAAVTLLQIEPEVKHQRDDHQAPSLFWPEHQTITGGEKLHELLMRRYQYECSHLGLTPLDQSRKLYIGDLHSCPFRVDTLSYTKQNLIECLAIVCLYAPVRL